MVSWRRRRATTTEPAQMCMCMCECVLSEGWNTMDAVPMNHDLARLLTYARPKVSRWRHPQAFHRTSTAAWTFIVILIGFGTGRQQEQQQQQDHGAVSRVTLKSLQQEWNESEILWPPSVNRHGKAINAWLDDRRRPWRTFEKLTGPAGGRTASTWYVPGSDNLSRERKMLFLAGMWSRS